MNIRFESSYLAFILITATGWLPPLASRGQAFTTLHTFSSASGSYPVFVNADGDQPNSLVLSGTNLYGATSTGGTNGWGTIFRMNMDGTGFANLQEFTGIGADGGSPSHLMLVGNSLRGVVGIPTYPPHIPPTFNPGLFTMNTDGTGLSAFGSTAGGSLDALVLSGNTFYGTAPFGGPTRAGSVFAMQTNGQGYADIYLFTNGLDGDMPSQLIVSGNTLYGTAQYGGAYGNGTVFSLSTSGSNFTTLYSFAGLDSYAIGPMGLILSGNTLYGTTLEAGSSRVGTIFRINTDGTGFTNLFTFTRDNGAYPGEIIKSGNTLYGETSAGGSFGAGTLYAINTDGTGFISLYNFTGGSDGDMPQTLILSGHSLFGTTYQGGAGSGTVFSLSFQPQLTISHASTNVILTWPTNLAGFDFSGYSLWSTTNFGSPSGWSTVTPGSVVIGGQNTVTNAMMGQRKFFRLAK